MNYRICKTFEIESGHMLSKHPGRCRFPHGHSRRVEIILASNTLDQNDMVCDFKTIKLALDSFIDQFDHALAINSNDPSRESIEKISERVVVFDNLDPTTEVLAKYIYDYLKSEIASAKTYKDDEDNEFTFSQDVKIERVRVSETSTSWAEYYY